MSARYRRIPAILLRALREATADIASAARHLGLDPEALDRPIREDAIHAFLALLTPALPLEFGLDLGTRVTAEDLGLPGLSTMFVKDFGSALARLAFYAPVLGDELTLSADGTALTMRAEGDPRYVRRRVDAFFSAIVALGRQLTGQDIRPARVTYSLPPPATQMYRDRYRRAFGSNVKFDQRSNTLFFSAVDIARPLIGACATIAETFALHAAEARTASTEILDVAARIRAVLRGDLFGRCPTLSELALLIGVPRQHLHMRMQQTNTRLRPLVDAVREERATLLKRYSAYHSHTKIAYLVGTDDSSLRKMSRRWSEVPSDDRGLL